MATQKPISTISYNSEAFLREKLEGWKEAHIIQSYQYICHKGEDGDKDHIHLRIEPNKKLDPMELTEQLKEYDPKHPCKPLCVRPWRASKEEDWCLYAVHDEPYLKLKYGGAEKGEKIPYDWQDIKAPEEYDVEVMYIRAKQSLKHTSSSLALQLQSGKKAVDLIGQGENPFIINALNRALAETDYQRLLAQYSDLERQLSEAKAAYDGLETLILDYLDEKAPDMMLSYAENGSPCIVPRPIKPKLEKVRNGAPRRSKGQKKNDDQLEGQLTLEELLQMNPFT